MIHRCRRWLWKRKWLVLVAVTVFGFTLTPIMVLGRTYLIIHPDTVPTAMPSALVLEAQTEGFTCGYHALSTVYRAYGLDPVAERARWRLGVDTKAVFWASDSTGALHPDLYMVFAQDHFSVRAVDLEADDAWEQLQDHLKEGHLAVLLIARPENGNLHWVTAAASGREGMQVFDSLLAEPMVQGQDYWEQYVLTAIMVRPFGEDAPESLSSWAAHRAGAKELARSVKRMKKG